MECFWQKGGSVAFRRFSLEWKLFDQHRCVQLGWTTLWEGPAACSEPWGVDLLGCWGITLVAVKNVLWVHTQVTNYC